METPSATRAGDRRPVASELPSPAARPSTPPPAGASRPRVAYIMSRFPKLTETFILYEMLAVERQGVHVDVYPLLRARDSGVHTEGASLWTKLVERFRAPRRAPVMHAEAEALIARARFTPLASPAVLMSQAYYLARRPRAYAGALATLMRATWGSRRFFLGGLSLFPQAAHNARRMAADGVTHVHAHFASHPAAAAYVIHRLTGIPFSFTAHGSDLHVDRHMLCEKVAAADFVASVSDFNRRVILEHCRPRLGDAAGDKVVVVRCGVDAAVFRPRPADGGWAGDTAGANGHASPSGGSLRVLCIGTLYEVKGQGYLIEACRQLVARGADVRCDLVGEGPHEDLLRAQAVSAGLEGRVRFLGRRTREEVAALLNQADVLAVPSVPTADGRREGLPVVLMEAMASGVAVVASDLSGIPELVEDGRTGLLAPPGDAARLADALARLAADGPLRRRLGTAGRERVLGEYDIHANAAKLAARFHAEVPA